MVNLYLLEATSKPDEERALALLQGEKRKRVLRQTQEQRQLSAWGVLLLAHALAREFGWALAPGELAEGEWGKPCLDVPGAPQFNLSHSGKMVACAIARNRVGVDVEKLHNRDDREIAALFHPEERAFFFSLCEAEQTDAFYRFWTCKESYMKYTGQGSHLPLDAFSVYIPQEKRFGPGKSCTQECRIWQGNLPGYRLAVCHHQGDSGVQLHHIDPHIIYREGVSP